MKRALKVVAAVLLVLVIAFLSVGLIWPQYTYENTVEIDRPVAEVWTVATDSARLKDWLPGFERIENVRGEPLEVGSQWRLFFVEDGPFGEEKIELFETVTACEPEKLFAFDYETDPMTGTTSLRFEEVDGRTRVTAESSVEGRNLLWASLLFLSKSVMQNRAQESYQKLAEACEESG